MPFNSLPDLPPTGPIETVRILEKAKTLLPKRTFSEELIELIFEQPYCKIRMVEQAGIAKRLTATRYLRDLERAGFVRSVKRGTELIFINQGLWQLLTDERLPTAARAPRA